MSELRRKDYQPILPISETLVLPDANERLARLEKQTEPIHAVGGHVFEGERDWGRNPWCKKVDHGRSKR